jgi:saccharopine dehydrogenase (NADP+, L-glutamate forming)
MPECETVIRGTLRYSGFPEFIKVLVDMGLLSDATQTNLAPTDSTPLAWSSLTASLLGSKSTSEADLVAALEKKASLPASEKARIIEGLRWIGLFSNEQVPKRSTPLDSLCATLESKMQFGPGERDLVFLQHRFDIEWADGRTETRTSTLVENGDPKGYSAVSENSLQSKFFIAAPFPVRKHAVAFHAPYYACVTSWSRIYNSILIHRRWLSW